MRRVRQGRVFCLRQPLAKAKLGKRKEELMVKEEISKEDMKKAERFLEGYKTHKNLYKIDLYEKSRGLVSEWEAESPNELFLARARMFDVRHAIMDMPNSDEKLFLYFHYIKGESVERCGDMLGISRSTAFRVKRRAVELFVKHRREEGEHAQL